MKISSFIFALSFIVFAHFNAGAQWVWAKNAAGYGATHPNHVTTDPSGNVIIAGEIFLAKYNSSGSLLWMKNSSSGFRGNALSVCTDDTGNIFVTGFFTGPTITFDTSFTLTNSGMDDIFLAKYDPSGKIVWVKKAGGTSSDDAYAIATDALGNIYIAGGFTSPSITFGTTTLTSSGMSMFLVKYNPSGDVIWAKAQNPGSIICRVAAINIDHSNHILVAGSFSGGAMGLGSITLTNPVSSYPDPFVAKYDTAGNILWAKGGTGNYYDGAAAITTDAANNSYVAGTFTSNIITFGTITLTNASTGSMDPFIVSYDPAGNIRWAKHASGVGNEEVLSTTTDHSGNVYIAGAFGDPTVSFGSMTLTNSSSSGWNLFVAKYDTTGVELVAISAGGADNEADCITTDKSGNMYVSGSFNSPTLQLGATILTYSGGSYRDIFVARFNGDVMSIPLSGPISVKGIVYPNPAGAEIFITAPIAITDVTIIDLSGQIVLKNTYNSTKIHINTSSLTKGMYQVVLNNSQVIKFNKE